jgi:hypothetical protein
MNRTLTYLLILVAIVLVVLLAAAGLLLIRDELAQNRPAAEVVLAPATATVGVDSVEIATPTSRALPMPVMELLPTDTPAPTSTPTDTPVPTETPLPTDTAAPTATAVAVIAPPRATNTPVPPTQTPAPTAVPQDTRGLSGTFSIEGGSSFAVNQEIWFNFHVANSSGAPVYFDVLGVYPKKDGSLRPDLIQASWGGNPGDAVPAGGLPHRDHIKIPETGNFSLRLAICFDASYHACKSGGGSWVFLSGEIPVTVR